MTGLPEPQVAVAPQSNIVCFRYVAGSGLDRDALQRTLRDRLLEGGQFFITRTQLGGKTYLRVVIINPLTRRKELLALIDELEHLGEVVAAG